jgi:hypothetical protein
VAVAREELADPERARTVIGAEEHDVSETLGDELHAAQDERPHQDAAELGIGLEQVQAVVAVDLDDLPFGRGSHADQRAPPGEEADLARELAGPQVGHELLGAFGHPHDLDAAGHDDEHPGPLGVPVQKHIADPHGHATSVRREPLHLSRTESRNRRSTLAVRGERASGARFTVLIVRVYAPAASALRPSLKMGLEEP